MKSRKPLTSGKPGRSTAPPAPPVWTASSSDREDDDRRHQLRAPEGLLDRAAPERADHAQVLHAGSDHTALVGRRLGRPRRRPRGGRPVFATNTSSSVGSTRSSDSTASPASSSARTTGATSAAPCSSSTSTRPSFCGQRPAEPRDDLLGARSTSPSQIAISRCGAADLGLERVRRALGDDQPAGDDPDAVGELVGLLQVLGGEEDGRALAVQLLDLLPDRLAADRVEAGGRLVEEEHPRLVDQRRGEVEPAPHPARVGADPPVGRARPGPTRSSSASACGSPSPRGSPWRVAWRRISSRPVISGSSAASCSATPIELADVARLADDVVAGDAGAAAGRAQQRRQHPHRGRLAGPVRAEEGVDLALGDLQVNAVDGLDTAVELPLQARTSIAATRGDCTEACPGLASARREPHAARGRCFQVPWPKRELSSFALLGGCARVLALALGCERRGAKRRLDARTPARSVRKSPCRRSGGATGDPDVADGRRALQGARTAGSRLGGRLQAEQDSEFFGDFFPRARTGSRRGDRGASSVRATDASTSSRIRAPGSHQLVNGRLPGVHPHRPVCARSRSSA